MAARYDYYEYKYLVPNEKLSEVKTILDTLYGGSDPFPMGVVDSLYFDTFDRKCVDECQNGEPDKSKFRVRGYGDGNFVQVHLKSKTLYGVSKYKSKIRPISYVHGQAPTWDEIVSSVVGDGNFSKIRSLGDQYGTLVPLVRIRYFRFRYRLYDYRITLDTRIEALGPSSDTDFHSDFCVLPDNVLEVKTVDPRPHLPLVGLCKLPQVSFSKFYLGYRMLEEFGDEYYG